MTPETVQRLLSELTVADKVQLTHGANDTEGTATGFVPGHDEHGVPDVRFTDGPLGVRTDEPATAFPAPLALASSFDPDLARDVGAALGREAKARNQDVLLGPGLNLVRVPHCGRNFEYFSEDPVVTGWFAASVVTGVESEAVVATPKHFVANNQETARASVDAAVDERVLRELYLPGFRDAVEAGAGAVMSAYNRVNGTYMSEHDHLIGEVLKAEWGFEGVVMSDWFGTESVVETANGGLDLQMPGISARELFASMGMDPADADPGAFDDADGMPDPRTGGLYRERLVDAVESGDVPESRLDDMVERYLTQLQRHGLLDGSRSDPDGAVDTPRHRALAQRVAERGTVLLDNDGVLPLDDDADVAVVGPNVEEAILGGGGSSETTPFTEATPVEGVEARADGAVSVARGVPRVEDVSLFDAFGDDGTDGGDDGDGPDVSIDSAVAAAEDADVAVVFVRDQATEALDRESIALPGDQDELVEAVAAANDHTVVVANTSGPVELPWRDEAAAVVASWYPGQAHGDAAGAVLYGDSDPGGRLPVTFAPEDEYPATTERQFPGVDGEVRYDEGLLVGYRHFDATDAEPTYPFGHGHSYAAFAYSDIEAVDDATVAVTVENTADRFGREVVQAYVAAPDTPGALQRPPRELGGFAALSLDPGESRRVSLSLDDRAFGRYDAEAGWTVDAGDHVVSVGRSAADLRLETVVER